MTPGENITAEGLATIARAFLREMPCPLLLVCTRNYCCIHDKHSNAPWRDIGHQIAAKEFLETVVWG